MRMPGRASHMAVIAAAALLLVLPPAYLIGVERGNGGNEPVRILLKYLKAAYARDYKQAYRLISSQDRRLKTEKVYVRERGPFTGFTLEIARKLSELIEVRPFQVNLDHHRARIKAALKLPDANTVAPLVLDWDEERLNALPISEQRRVLASVDRLKRDSGLKMIDGEEEFVLVKENQGWKVSLDWAAGIQVNFNATVPNTNLLEARPLIRETLARPSELFTVAYKVKNRSLKDVFARVVHHVQPKALAEHLDIVECALLLPVRVLPGEEREYSTTYLVRGDLPEGTKELSVTYEFKVEP